MAEQCKTCGGSGWIGRGNIKIDAKTHKGFAEIEEKPCPKCQQKQKGELAQKLNETASAITVMIGRHHIEIRTSLPDPLFAVDLCKLLEDAAERIEELEILVAQREAEIDWINDHLFKNIDTNATRSFIKESTPEAKRLLRICDLVDTERAALGKEPE